MKKFQVFLAAIIGICALGNPVYAKVFDLPDFTSGKAVWILRAGAGFNSTVGDWKDEMRDGWEDAHKIDLTEAVFPSNTSFDISFGFNKSFGRHPLYWGDGTRCLYERIQGKCRMVFRACVPDVGRLHRTSDKGQPDIYGL